MKDLSLIPPTKVGMVGKPLGLEGLFCVGGRDSLFPDTISEVSIAGQRYVISQYLLRQNRAHIALVGLESRTAIEALKGQVMLGHDVLPPLMGAIVKAADDTVFGTVVNMYNHGASDTLEIANDDGALIELPYVNDYFKEGLPPRLKVSAAMFSDLWYQP